MSLHRDLLLLGFGLSTKIDKVGIWQHLGESKSSHCQENNADIEAIRNLLTSRVPTATNQTIPIVTEPTLVDIAAFNHQKG